MLSAQQQKKKLESILLRVRKNRKELESTRTGNTIELSTTDIAMEPQPIELGITSGELLTEPPEPTPQITADDEPMIELSMSDEVGQVDLPAPSTEPPSEEIVLEAGDTIELEEPPVQSTPAERPPKLARPAVQLPKAKPLAAKPPVTPAATKPERAAQPAARPKPKPAEIELATPAAKPAAEDKPLEAAASALAEALEASPKPTDAPTPVPSGIESEVRPQPPDEDDEPEIEVSFGTDEALALQAELGLSEESATSPIEVDPSLDLLTERRGQMGPSTPVPGPTSDRPARALPDPADLPAAISRAAERQPKVEAKAEPTLPVRSQRDTLPMTYAAKPVPKAQVADIISDPAARQTLGELLSAALAVGKNK